MLKKRGSFVAVGCGIRARSQTTAEALFQIERADIVLSLVADLLTEYWISSINHRMESFADLYAAGKPRRQTYEEMVQKILAFVRAELRVCAVSYGHPGVFAYPLHEAIRRARSEGYVAEMLPAVSAEDCMFADLGIDPSISGCRSYEATDFLIHRRGVDPTQGLVLWQVGVIGEAGHRAQFEVWNRHGLEVLQEVLLESYDAGHKIYIYEAARYPVSRPIVECVALEKLAISPVTALSTLYLPPMTKPVVDRVMLERLGMNITPRGEPPATT